MVPRAILLIGSIPFPFFLLKDFSFSQSTNINFQARTTVDGSKYLNFQNIDKTISIGFKYAPKEKEDLWVLGLLEILKQKIFSGSSFHLLASEGTASTEFLGEFVCKDFSEDELKEAGFLSYLVEIKIQLEKIRTRRVKYFDQL